MNTRLALVAAIHLAVLGALPPERLAAQEPAGGAVAPAARQPPERSDPDVRVDVLQPDFNLAALPTTLRMPSGKWAFRVTHRFTRSLSQGSFGDQASNLFGLDGGSQVGLEFRIGLRPGTQFALHRTSDRSIQLVAQHNVMNERDGGGFGLDAVATLEGDDNLSERYRNALGLVASKTVGRLGTLYAEPIVVLNANPLETGDAHTVMLGLGGRIRIGRSAYVLAEYTPRLAGYRPLADQITFGVERRTGGHLFQINVGNGFGTTLGQLAAGGLASDQWFLGFNLARKFF